MSTEETELTFIRCPSCRSLVPAVATRCRMCGFSFEAGAESAEGSSDEEDLAAKSRVRQRTITATPEEVAELSASEEYDPETSVLESFSAAILEAKPEPIDEFEIASPSEVKQHTHDFDAEIEEAEEESYSEPEPEPEIEVEASPEVQDEPEPKAEEPRAEPEAEVSAAAEETDSSRDEEEAPTEKKRKRRRRRKKKDSTVISEGELSMNGTSSSDSSQDTAFTNQPSRSQKSAPKVADKTSSDRLIGWFVNFVDESSPSSTELRSRRFFISGEKLRENDLLLDGSDVSARSAAVPPAHRGVTP